MATKVPTTTLLGIIILFSIFLTVFLPFHELIGYEQSLDSTSNEGYQLAESVDRVWEIFLFFLEDSTSFSQFILLVFMVILAILLSHHLYKLSSLLWLCIATLLFSEWFKIGMAAHVSQGAIALIEFLPRQPANYAITNKISPISVIVIFCVFLAIINLIIQARSKQEKIEFISERFFDYKVIITIMGMTTLILLPIGFGPLFSSHSIIYPLILHNELYLSLNRMVLPLLVLIIVILWAIALLVIIPFDLVLEYLDRRKAWNFDLIWGIIPIFLLIRAFLVNLEDKNLNEVTVNLILFFFPFFLLVGAILSHYQAKSEVKTQFRKTLLNFYDFLNKNKVIRISFLLISLFILIFPSVSLYSSQSLQFFPNMENDSISSSTEIIDSNLYDNGTLIVEISPIIMGQGMFKTVDKTITTISLIFQTCFLKLFDAQYFDNQVIISSIRATDPLVNVENDERTFEAEGGNQTLPIWRLDAIRNGTTLLIDINVSFLSIGDKYTLIFGYPSEDGAFSQSQFTRYVISLLVEEVTVLKG